jgi:putative flippase GtrA
MGRRRRIGREAARFLAVGGVATAVALLTFNLLVHGFDLVPPVMNDRPLTALVIGHGLGMAVSYRGSRSWAFRHREPVGPAGGRVAFLVINVATMAVPVACLAVSRYLLGLDSALADNVAANVVGMGLGTAARFWAVRRFVFRSPRRARRRQLAS